MASRRQAREHALQVLFQIDLTGDPPEEALALHWSRREIAEGTRRFAEALVLGAHGQLVRIDALIQAASENWRLDRMAAVDRNVIRLAVFELLEGSDAPAAVAIDEAIEVAKRYGGEESSQFVNGVLDAIRKRLERSGAAPVTPSSGRS